MKFTEEHQYGSEVELWLVGSEVVGRFSYSEGLAGDTPTGMLQNVKYSEKTGEIHFEVKMSIGGHSCLEHKNIPSRDLIKFEGVLGKESLKGLLSVLDALHGYRIFGEEQTVELGRNLEERPIQTYTQWTEENEIALRFRGPKW